MVRTDEQKENLKDSALSKLWLRHSFLAYLLSKLDTNWTDKGEHPAPAWTDDLSITINWKELDNDLWKDLSSDNLVFLLAHELLHILDYTTARRGDRIPELWNISADYVINASLIHNQTGQGTANPIGEMPHNDDTKTPDNPKGLIGLYDPRFVNMTIEQVYDILYNENKEQIEKAIGNQQQMEQLIQDLLNGKKVLDENFGASESIDPEQVEQLKQEIKAKISNILQEMGTTAGKLDSAMARSCEILLAPPKFDWKGFLSNYLKSFIKGDSTWKKLSRRTWGVGQLMAGVKVESQIKLAIAIDTSGSVSAEQVNEMLSHIQKIMRSFKSFEIDIWCFSTKVHLDTLKSFNKGNIAELPTYTIKSNGGTDIESNFTYLNQSQKTYNAFICMTDGYDSIEHITFNKCPVIWAITGNDNFVSPKNIKNARVMTLS